jgi:hypothetical protein
MTPIFSTRSFAWAVIAVMATVTLHGGWLAAMDRDALAVPAVAARA